MGQILTMNDTMMCPHGGSVTLVSTQSRASAGGGLILRPGDVFVVAGCPFTPVSPHPCVTVEWQAPATRCKAGDSVLTTSSIGLCKAADQAPQGMVIIAVTQMNASAQ